MYDTLCTLPLSADLLAQAVHPRNPILSVGLASGVVQTFRLPAPDADPSSAKSPENSISKSKKSNVRRSSILSDSSTATDGTGFISTAWRTRRHKGSCRTVTYSLDGEELFSAGTDGIVKVARAEDGRVTAKIRVPLHNSLPDHPTCLHPLSPQTLLLGTEASALHVLDLRSSTPSSMLPARPQATFYPHNDYISSITSLPPSSESTSGASKQCVSTGGNTLAVTDFRRGVLAKSEEQDEELLCSVLVTRLGSGKKRKLGGSGSGGNGGDDVLVGDADGVLSLWRKGEWDDRGGERVVLSGGGESVDCVAAVPGQAGKVVAGLGNGFLVMADIGTRKELEAYRHDELEGAVKIGFEVGGRMVSGGGAVVKVWGQRKDGEEGAEEEEGESEEDEDDEEEETVLASETKQPGSKRAAESASSSDEEESSSAEEEKKRKRKKKKKKRRKGKENGVPKPAVLGFEGLD